VIHAVCTAVLRGAVAVIDRLNEFMPPGDLNAASLFVAGRREPVESWLPDDIAAGGPAC
jgi:hypothetical protein